MGNLELTNGRITGGIPQSEISNSVIPAIAVLVDRLVNDPNTPQATRDQVLNLFDRNKDQRITAAEVRDNALIKTFLSGDVDVDGDGQLELTLGVGFNAIRAVIP